MRSGSFFDSPQRLFRQRTVADEYCFDSVTADGAMACNGNPYAEF